MTRKMMFYAGACFLLSGPLGGFALGLLMNAGWLGKAATGHELRLDALGLTRTVLTGALAPLIFMGFGILMDLVFCKVTVPFAMLSACLQLSFGPSRWLSISFGAVYAVAIGLFVSRYGFDSLFVIAVTEQPMPGSPFYAAIALLVGTFVGYAMPWTAISRGEIPFVYKRRT